MYRLYIYVLCAVLVTALTTHHPPREWTAHARDLAKTDDAYLLALNMYFHRGEANTDMGRKAITAVVFNRLDDRDHYWGPKSIRGIITFRYVPGRKDCDWSWYCDGKDDVPDDVARFNHDLALAKRWLNEYHKKTFQDPTGGATWMIYKKSPYPKSWPPLVLTKTYGEYSFYRYP